MLVNWKWYDNLPEPYRLLTAMAIILPLGFMVQRGSVAVCLIAVIAMVILGLSRYRAVNGSWPFCSKTS